MTFFLTSSPCIPGASRAILNPANGFADEIRKALPEHPRCLFICSSPDTPEKTERFAWDMQDAFQLAGIPFRCMHVLDGRNASAAASLIRASDFVILAGGHVPTQNRFFRRIGLAGLLQDYGGVIMGISAGSMNAAKVVYAQPELAGEALDPDYERFLPGLGLTEIQILPHYQMLKEEMLDGMRLFDDITFADSMGCVFYVLPDGSYLMKQDGREIIAGECYVIHNGCMEKLSSDGARIEV